MFGVFGLLQNTYEEIRLAASDVGDKTKFLKEGMDCILLFWNGKVPAMLFLTLIFISSSCIHVDQKKGEAMLNVFRRLSALKELFESLN